MDQGFEVLGGKVLPLRGLAVARAIVRFSTPWAPREFWSDVETKRCHAARNRRLAFAETDLSHVLACLCWHRLGARPGLLDFNEVSATADVHFSCADDGSTRISRITAAWIRPSFARRDRSGDDFGRQVLF